MNLNQFCPSDQQSILSYQQRYGNMFLNRVYVCYVKLSRKRPEIEKT